MRCPVNLLIVTLNFLILALGIAIRPSGSIIRVRISPMSFDGWRFFFSPIYWYPRHIRSTLDSSYYEPPEWDETYPNDIENDDIDADDGRQKPSLSIGICLLQFRFSSTTTNTTGTQFSSIHLIHPTIICNCSKNTTPMNYRWMTMKKNCLLWDFHLYADPYYPLFSSLASLWLARTILQIRLEQSVVFPEENQNLLIYSLYVVTIGSTREKNWNIFSFFQLCSFSPRRC